MAIYRNIIMAIILSSVLAYSANAAVTVIKVSGCSGGTACNTINYSINTTATIAHHINKGAVGTANYTNNNIPSDATINSVTLQFYHGGQSGISNNWGIQAQNKTSGSAYCAEDSGLAHTSTNTYTNRDETSCGLTADELNELTITFTNNDGGSGQAAFIYFANISVDYTLPNQKPYNITPLRVNKTTVTTGDTVLFFANATDPEADNFRMTVCKTNSITDAYPGTCAASQTVCTSGATTSNQNATCANITNSAMEGTNTYYAFFCDAGSSTCNSTASTVSLTVNPPTGWLNVSILSPQNNTYLNLNTTFYLNASVRCEGGTGYVCGTVTGLARYNATGVVDTNISNVTSTTPLYLMPTAITPGWRNIGNSTGCYDVTAIQNWTGNITNGTVTILLDNTTINYTAFDSNGNGTRIYNGTCASPGTEQYFALHDGSIDKDFYWRSTVNNTKIKVNYNRVVTNGSIINIAIISTTNTTRSPYDNPNKTFYAYDDWNSFDTNRWTNASCSITTSGGILTINGCTTFRGTVVSNANSIPENQPLMMLTNASKAVSSESGLFMLYASNVSDSSCGQQVDKFGVQLELVAGFTTTTGLGGNKSGAGSCAISSFNASTLDNTNYLVYTINYTTNVTSGVNVSQSNNRIHNYTTLSTYSPDNFRLAIQNREGNIGGGNLKVDWVELGTHPSAWTVSVSIGQDVNGAPLNPGSCGSMNNGDQCNLSWIVNLTNTGSYAVDVLFNSTTYYPTITQNSTEDRVVINLSTAGPPPEDSCTYTSGDWTIQCSDNCNLNINTNLLNNKIIFTGSAGHVGINANIFNFSKAWSDGCRVAVMSTGALRT